MFDPLCSNIQYTTLRLYNVVSKWSRFGRLVINSTRQLKINRHLSFTQFASCSFKENCLLVLANLLFPSQKFSHISFAEVFSYLFCRIINLSSIYVVEIYMYADTESLTFNLSLTSYKHSHCAKTFWF